MLHPLAKTITRRVTRKILPQTLANWLNFLDFFTLISSPFSQVHLSGKQSKTSNGLSKGGVMVSLTFAPEQVHELGGVSPVQIFPNFSNLLLKNLSFSFMLLKSISICLSAPPTSLEAQVHWLGLHLFIALISKGAMTSEPSSHLHLVGVTGTSFSNLLKSAKDKK